MEDNVTRNHKAAVGMQSTQEVIEENASQESKIEESETSSLTQSNFSRDLEDEEVGEGGGPDGKEKSTQSCVVNDPSPPLQTKQKSEQAQSSQQSPLMKTQANSAKKGKAGGALLRRGSTMGSKPISEKKRFAIKQAQFSQNLNASVGSQGKIKDVALLDVADRTYQTPNTLDLFALETRTRRTIAELIKPIVTEAVKDRREVAQLDVKHDRLAERLDALEYSLGIIDRKPQCFIEIERELAEIKAQSAVVDNDSKYRDALFEQKLEAMDRTMLNCLSQMKTIERLTKVREEETNKSNKAQLEMKTKFSFEIQALQDKMADSFTKFSQKMHLSEQQSALNNGKVAGFDAYLKEMQSLIEQIYEKATKHTVQITDLCENSVQYKEFERTTSDLYKQTETIRYATYDNFRVIRATDNYIEKYLPFTMQALISRNLCSFLKDKELDTMQKRKKHEVVVLTKEELAEQERFKNFKHVEYQIYKDFHRIAVNDDGIPKIKKTSFRMPGYRQILSERKIEDYTIDNDIVYERFHEKAKERALRESEIQSKLNFQMRQSLLSSEVMQDIMPVAELSSSTSQLSAAQNTVKVNQLVDVEPDENGAERHVALHRQKLYEDERSSSEQTRIEFRQVKNIAKMMNQGNVNSEKRRQASPFLGYALDKYNIPLEDVPSEQGDDGFDETGGSSDDEGQAAQEMARRKGDALDKDNIVKRQDANADLADGLETSSVNIGQSGENVRTEVSPDNKRQGAVSELKSAFVPSPKTNKNQKQLSFGLLNLNPAQINLRTSNEVARARKPDTQPPSTNRRKSKESRSRRMTMKTSYQQAVPINTFMTKTDSHKVPIMQHKQYTVGSSLNGDDSSNLYEMESSDILSKKAANQIKLDQLTNCNLHRVGRAYDESDHYDTGFAFHERRKDTFYLVGMDDLEPFVSDLLHKAHALAQDANKSFVELKKEMAEHKAHIEKLTNNTDMPLLKPIKAIIDEQITAMYSFQNEIKLEMKLLEERGANQEILVEGLQDRIRKVYLSLPPQLTTLTKSDLDSVMNQDCQHLQLQQQPGSEHTTNMLIQSEQQQQQDHLDSHRNELRAQHHQLSSRSRHQRNLTAQTHRSNQQQQLTGVLGQPSSGGQAASGRHDCQTTNALVMESLKLQNILNYEVLQRLNKGHEPREPGQAPFLGKQSVEQIAIVHENINRLTQSSNNALQEPNQAQPTNIEVKKRPKKEENRDALRESGSRPEPHERVSDLTWQTVQKQNTLLEGIVGTNTGEKTIDNVDNGSMMELGQNCQETTDKDKTTTPHISDGTATPTMLTHRQDMLPNNVATFGTTFRKEISMWDQPQLQAEQSKAADCGVLLSMLDQVRLKLEQRLNSSTVRHVSQELNQQSSAINVLENNTLHTQQVENNQDEFEETIVAAIPIKTLSLERGGSSKKQYRNEQRGLLTQRGSSARRYTAGNASHGGGGTHRRNLTMQNPNRTLQVNQSVTTTSIAGIHQQYNLMANQLMNTTQPIESSCQQLNQESLTTKTQSIYKRINVQQRNSQALTQSQNPKGGQLVRGVHLAGACAQNRFSSIPSMAALTQRDEIRRSSHGGSSATLKGSLITTQKPILAPSHADMTTQRNQHTGAANQSYLAQQQSQQPPTGVKVIRPVSGSVSMSKNRGIGFRVAKDSLNSSGPL